jgi:hypothetical protein
VAVRANDIALRGFREDRIDPGSADHPRYPDPLLAAVSMVEVHRARRKLTATVSAWDLAKAVQQRCVLGPSAPLPREVFRATRGRTPEQPFLMLRPRAEPMTNCTDDLALRNLRQEALTGAPERSRARQAK